VAAWFSASGQRPTADDEQFLPIGSPPGAARQQKIVAAD
jgi:hypothetical protein